MEKGKITLKSATIGTALGAVVGGLVEGIITVGDKALKTGAGLTKKSIIKGREHLASGLQAAGHGLSDEGKDEHKLNRARKLEARANALKSSVTPKQTQTNQNQPSQTKPKPKSSQTKSEYVPASTGVAEVVNTIPKNVVIIPPVQSQS